VSIVPCIVWRLPEADDPAVPEGGQDSLSPVPSRTPGCHYTQSINYRYRARLKE